MRKETTTYRLRIETNLVTASFEKEICAFMTGQVGDCKTGQESMFNSPAAIREEFGKCMEKRYCADTLFRHVDVCADNPKAFELYFKIQPGQALVDHIKMSFDEFSSEKKKKIPMMPKMEIKKMTLIKERTVYEEIELDLIEHPQAL